MGLAVVAQGGFIGALDDGVAVAVHPAEDGGIAGEAAAVALHLEVDITER
jgi:hypothetical protein